MSILLGLSWRRLSELLAMRPQRQLRELYWFLIFFSLATALITVFEPVFLYQQGVSLAGIALYYAMHYSIYVILLPLGGKFAAYFGYESSLTLSSPIFVVYFLMLARMPQQPELFWVAPFVLALFKIFYWPAFYASFATFTDLKNRGTEQSWVQFIQYGAGVVGPLAGGLLVKSYGFPTLFILTALIVALAGVCLLRTNDNTHPRCMPYGAPWRLLRLHHNRRMIVSALGWGENLVYLAIWPVFLFLVVGSVERLGLVAALSAAVATLAGFFIGEMSDRLTTRRTLRIFAPLMALSYLPRGLLVVPLLGAVGDVVARVTTVGISIPFVSRLNRQARKHEPLEYMLAFEIVLAAGKAVAALGLVWLFMTVPLETAFAVSFVGAGVLSLLYMVL